MDDRRPSRRGEQGKGEALTVEQTARVKAMLAKYDANSLTADQAKAIHEAFRQAGLRGGPSPLLAPDLMTSLKAGGMRISAAEQAACPSGHFSVAMCQSTAGRDSLWR
jgi:hypothetical protein